MNNECHYPTCKLRGSWAIYAEGYPMPQRFACIDHIGAAIALDVVSPGATFAYTVRRNP
jgi:hypothetical protein